MHLLVEPVRSLPAATLRREIDRFIAFLRKRSHPETPGPLRAETRYRRSWPLLIAPQDRTQDRRADHHISVALSDASPSGVAFLSSQPFPLDSIVMVRLFWQDQTSPQVPAVIRHTTQTEHGYLVGAEFLVEDDPF